MSSKTASTTAAALAVLTMLVGATSFALGIFFLCAALSMALAFVSGRLWERASPQCRRGRKRLNAASLRGYPRLVDPPRRWA
jgi:hypothetical protein